ncbi:MAG: GumC family protein [Candidatus Krumholzibacteriia bacterium]
MDPYQDEGDSGGGGFDPLQLWRMFARRRWLFIVPFFLCLGMAAVAIKTQNPVYYSSAQVQVIQEAPTARSLNQEAARYSRPLDPDVESLVMIRTIVTSPKFLERVVRDLSLHKRAVALGLLGEAPAGLKPEDWDERTVMIVARWLADQVRVKQDDKHLFSIGMRDNDADRAYQLARKVLDEFLAEERANRMEPSSATRDFLEGQRQLYEQQLAEAQSRLTEFQRSMLAESLAGNPVTQDNLNLAESVLTRLRSQAYDAGSAELINLERLARAAVAPPPTVDVYVADGDIAEAMRELVNLEYDQAIGGIRGGGGAAPEAGSNVLGTARLNLNNLLAARTGRLYPQLALPERNHLTQYVYAMLDREVAQRVVGRLQRNVQEFRGVMTRQPQQTAALDVLQKEVTRVQDLLQGLERDITQENLRLAANMSEIGYKIVVRQDPQRPFAPIEPNKMRLAFMGLALALAMGIGLVILAEFMDRSFKSLTDIEKALGLKVIGTLPMIETRLFSARRRRHPWIWAILIVSILVVAAAGFLFIYPRLT